MFKTFKKLVERRPLLFAGTLTVYLAIAIGYAATTFFRERQIVLEDRVLTSKIDAEEAKKEIKKIISVLSSIKLTPRFFKPLTFDEKWESEEQRAEVKRLLDYASFAVEKHDYEKAMDFYRDANQIKESLEGLYFSGRVAYRMGKYKLTERQWSKAIQLDSANKYPDLRLYLGILLYEVGRNRESKLLLRQYAGSQSEP